MYLTMKYIILLCFICAVGGQTCSPGTYNLNSVCTNCPAGTYQTGTGMTLSTDCINCQLGMFSSAAGLTTCTSCPNNSTTLATQSSSVSQCVCSNDAYMQSSAMSSVIYTFQAGSIWRYTSEFTSPTSIVANVVANVQFNRVAYDQLNKKIFISDYMGNRILLFDTLSLSTTTWIGTGANTNVNGNITVATVGSPSGIAFAPISRNLYVFCGTGTQIKVVNDSQILSWFSGSGTGSTTGSAAVTKTGMLSAMAINSAETILYAVDGSWHVVRAFNLTDGSSSVLVGSTSGYTDGVGTAAKFAGLSCIVILNDILYVSEVTNCLIRKIQISTRTVTTVFGTQGSCLNTNTTINGQTFYIGLNNAGDTLYFAATDLRQYVLSTGTVSTLRTGVAWFNGLVSVSTSCSYSIDNICMQCLACPDGFYCDNGTNTICPIGTYSQGFNRSSIASCIPCASGYYSATGATRCTICPANSSCTSTTVTPCPSGSTSAAGSAQCVCDAGSYMNNNVCIACPVGTFRSAVGGVSVGDCTGCLTGTYSIVSAATACVTCPANFYCSSTSSIACPANSFSTAGSSACSCVSGYYVQSNPPLSNMFTFDNRNGAFGVGPDGTVGYSANAYFSVAISSGTLSINGNTIPKGVQIATVLQNLTVILVAAGARGGEPVSNTIFAGSGAVVSTTVNLIAGDRLAIVVGQYPNKDTGTLDAGGGGGTYITKYNGQSFSLNSSHIPILIAGAGGGASRSGVNGNNAIVTSTNGGLSTCWAGTPSINGGGGAAMCGTGGNPSLSLSPSTGLAGSSSGGGGFLQAGGASARCAGSSFLSTTSGSDGGFGGGGCAWSGGAGGGGYSGGQGCNQSAVLVGGGGGSCYDINGVNNIATQVTSWILGTTPANFNSGWNYGNGYVRVYNVSSSLACTACKTCLGNANAVLVALCNSSAATDTTTCACNAGYYGDGITCTACAVGRTSSIGSATCTSCPANASTVGTGSTQCVCNDGFTNISGVCTRCSDGYYSKGGAACQTCPANSVGVYSDCLCSSGYTKYNVYNNSLILYYNFDSATAQDATLLTAAGSVTSGISYSANALWNGSTTAVFSGVTSTVLSPAISTVSFTNGYTICLWAKITTQVADGYLFELGDGTGSNRLITYNSGTSFALYSTFVGSVDVNWNWPGGMVLNQWNHFCITYQSPNYIFYQNGVYASTQTQSKSLTSIPSFYCFLGRGINFQYIKGMIDEFRVYNKVLSAGDVAYLYNLKSTEQSQGSACMSCPSNTYSSYNGTCGACPANAFASTGAASCTCNAGYYGTGSVCTICPLGTFSGIGALSCTSCPANNMTTKTTGSLNISQCVCVAGYFGDYIVNCTKCVTGTYSSAVGISTFANCLLCGSGSYSTVAGAISSATCSKCSAGGYSTGVGALSIATCSPCQAGTYSTGIGTNNATTCLSCGSGSYSTVTGAVSSANCLQCITGTYSSVLGATSTVTCLQCVAGTYSTLVGAISSSTCTQCVAGSYSTVVGAVSSGTCSQCNAPFFSNISGATSNSTCTSCATGMYNPNSGASTCASCWANSVSSADGLSCLCNAGYTPTDPFNSGLLALYTFDPSNRLANSYTGSGALSSLQYVGTAVGYTSSGPWAGTDAVVSDINKLNYLKIPDMNIGAISASTGFSICMWIDLITLSYYANIFSISSLSKNYGSGLVVSFQDTSMITVWVQAQQVFSSASLSYNTWKHFCITNSGRSYAFYIDGIQKSTFTATSDLQNTLHSYNYLLSGGQATDDFFGYVDEFRIFSKQLSISEVSNIYNYRGTSSLACASCSANTYSNLNGVCIQCPSNSISNTGSATCQCNVGYYGVWTNCIACQSGTFSNTTNATNVSSCIPCASNTYSANSSATSCPSCWANSYSSVGSTTCQCNSGYYAVGLTCVICPANSFCVNGQNTLCPVQSVSTTGSSSCACNPGYYGASCTICPANSYCTNNQVSTCPINTTSGAGASACVCMAGTTNISSVCTACKAGMYSLAGTVCSNCSQGFYSSDIGSSTCAVCSPGYYNSIPGSVLCIGCLSNSWCTAGTLNQCPLYSNSSVLSLSQQNCLCNAGYFGDGSKTGTSPCALCWLNFYCPGGNGNVSFACPLYSSSPPGSNVIDQCICNSGFIRQGDTCECAPNRFCPNSSSFSCPSNSSSPTGSQLISDCICDIGFYGLAETGCRSCPMGSFCPGNGTITQCTPNAVTAGSRSVSPLDCFCDRGYVGVQNDACEICPANSWCWTGVQNQCPSNSISPMYSNFMVNCTCSAGYWGPNGGPCFNCPVNNYCVGGTNYTSCPVNTLSNELSTDVNSCNCVSGYVKVAGVCLCAPGTRPFNDSSCEICGPNTYCNDNIQTTCPTNSLSLSKSVIVSDCICDMGYWRYDTNTCLACSSGSYKPIVNDSQCTLCPFGQFQTGLAATQCDACTAGSYADTVGWNTTCTVCVMNTYSDSSSAPCLSCPANSFTAAVASVSIGSCICNVGFYKLSPSTCSLCPANSNTSAIQGADNIDQCICYMGYTRPNSSTCTRCPMNTYCPDPDAVTALLCPDSMYSMQGSVSIDQCSCPPFAVIVAGSCQCQDGYHRVVNDTFAPYYIQCVVCPPGSFCVSGVKQLCPLGQYQTGQAATQCNMCSAGTYADVVGWNTTCNVCAINTYSDSSSAPCLSCPDNSFTLDNTSVAISSCLCNTGFYKLAPDTCASCPENSNTSAVQGVDTIDQCICYSGYMRPNSSTCVLCPMNAFCPDSMAMSALPCPNRTYSIQGSISVDQCSCQPFAVVVADACQCQDGFQQVVNDSFAPYYIQCIPCTPGSYCINGVKQQCPGGYFCPGSSTAVAIECLLGTYCPPGSSSATTCPPSTYSSTPRAVSSTVCQPCRLCDRLGTYELSACAASSDRQCYNCTNKPMESVYTSSTSNTCPYVCNSGYIGTMCMPCRPGYWCDRGLINTCPRNSISPMLSTELGNCSCLPGYSLGTGTYAATVAIPMCSKCTGNSVCPGGMSVVDPGYMMRMSLGLNSNDSSQTSVVDLTQRQIVRIQHTFTIPIFTNTDDDLVRFLMTIPTFLDTFSYVVSTQTSNSTYSVYPYQACYFGNCFDCDGSLGCLTVTNVTVEMSSPVSLQYDSLLRFVPSWPAVCDQVFYIRYTSDMDNASYVRELFNQSILIRSSLMVSSALVFCNDAIIAVTLPESVTRAGRRRLLASQTVSTASSIVYDVVCTNGSVANTVAYAFSSNVTVNSGSIIGSDATFTVKGFVALSNPIPTCLPSTYAFWYNDSFFRPQKMCLLCPYNYYCTNETATACPMNMYTAFNGSITLSDCLCVAGTLFVQTDDLTPYCTGCAAGSYCPSNTSTNLCPVSTYSTSGAVTIDDCIPCAYGSYSSVAGASYCTPCKANANTSTPGQTSIVACTCNPGYYRDSLYNCIPCAAGHRCIFNGYAACSAGYFSLDGASACTACAMGTYQERTSQTFCTDCPAGQTVRRGTILTEFGDVIPRSVLPDDGGDKLYIMRDALALSEGSELLSWSFYAQVAPCTVTPFIFDAVVDGRGFAGDFWYTAWLQGTTRTVYTTGVHTYALLDDDANISSTVVVPPPPSSAQYVRNYKFLGWAFNGTSCIPYDNSIGFNYVISNPYAPTASSYYAPEVNPSATVWSVAVKYLAASVVPSTPAAGSTSLFNCMCDILSKQLPDGYCRGICRPGKYAVMSEDSCVVCEQGNYCVNSVKRACPLGMSSIPGSVDCKPCPGPGTHSNMALYLCGLIQCLPVNLVPIGNSGWIGVGQIMTTVAGYMSPKSPWYPGSVITGLMLNAYIDRPVAIMQRLVSVPPDIPIAIQMRMTCTGMGCGSIALDVSWIESSEQINTTDTLSYTEHVIYNTTAFGLSSTPSDSDWVRISSRYFTSPSSGLFVLRISASLIPLSATVWMDAPRIVSLGTWNYSQVSDLRLFDSASLAIQHSNNFSELVPHASVLGIAPGGWMQHVVSTFRPPRYEYFVFMWARTSVKTQTLRFTIAAVTDLQFSDSVYTRKYVDIFNATNIMVPGASSAASPVIVDLISANDTDTVVSETFTANATWQLFVVMCWSPKSIQFSVDNDPDAGENMLLISLPQLVIRAPSIGCHECLTDNWCAGNHIYKCPLHTVSLSGAHTQKQCWCEAGYYGVVLVDAMNDVLSDTSPCSICPMNHYCPGGNRRIPCPSGHKSDVGASACVPCGVDERCTNGTINDCSLHAHPNTNMKIPTVCICDDGYMGDPDNCTVCSVGTYCAENIQYICPVNKSTSTPGSTNLLQCFCDRGYYGIGSDTCQLCERGYWCWTGIRNQCPLNSYSPVGSSYPRNCSCNPGFYGRDAGPCVTCSAGYYKSNAGDTPCVACEPGFYSTVVTATSASACVQCDAGYYNPLVGQYACVPCAAGTYTSTMGKTACDKCWRGAYSRNGYSTCTTCSSGTYSTTLGASSAVSCQDCPSGSWSGNNATLCVVCGECAFWSWPRNIFVGVGAISDVAVLTYNSNIQMAMVQEDVLISDFDTLFVLNPLATVNKTIPLALAIPYRIFNAIAYDPSSATNPDTRLYFFVSHPSNVYRINSQFMESDRVYPCNGPKGLLVKSQGTVLYVAQTDGVRVFQATTAQEIRYYPISNGGANYMCEFPDVYPNMLFVTTSNNGLIQLDLVTGNQTFLTMMQGLTACAFAGNGTFILFAQETTDQLWAYSMFNKALTRLASQARITSILPFDINNTLFLGIENEGIKQITLVIKDSASCSPGKYSYFSGLQTAEQCNVCPSGDLCPGGSDKLSCMPGTFSYSTGLREQGQCTMCPIGYYCMGGTQKTLCPKGSYSPYTGITRADDCNDCPVNFYCPNTTTIIQCPENTESVMRSTDLNDCHCAAGYRCEITKVIHAEVVLPISASEFTAEMRLLYIQAVALAANVDISSVIVVSVQQLDSAVVPPSGSGRRLMDSVSDGSPDSHYSLEVHTSIYNALDPRFDKLNAHFGVMGLPHYERITLSVHKEVKKTIKIEHISSWNNRFH